MEFNLFKNIQGQAKAMAKMVRGMSPKVKEVIGYENTNFSGTPVSKQAIQKKFSRNRTKEQSNLLQEKILAVLKDKESKEALYDQQDKLSKESIYGVLLDQFMEDAFGIDPDDNIVEVEVLDEDDNMRTLLQVFPDDLLQRTHIEELLTDYLKETYLKYGELFLRKYYHKGLLVRLEVMDGKYVYPICNGLGILFYLVIDPLANDFDVLDEDEVLCFQLNPQLRKIVTKDTRLEKLLAEQPVEVKELIPDAYKMGTPLLYNARNELTKLKIANLLTDLAQLKSLAMPTLLAVNVENIRDEEQLSELIDTYEDYLEDIVELPDVGDGDNVDLESLMNTSIKVIPVEGSGKNSLTDMGITPQATAADNNYLDKKKEDVALAAGFPLSALSAQTDTNSKTDLSSNRRYRNKCKAAQRFIVRPIHQEILVDYAMQDIDVSPEQVRVFCKAIISLDTAEDLEVSLGAITQVSQVWEALQTIKETAEELEPDEMGFLEYFNTMLGGFKGASQLLRKKQELEDQTEDDNFEEDEEDNSPSGLIPSRLPNKEPSFESEPDFTQEETIENPETGIPEAVETTIEAPTAETEAPTEE